MNLYSVRDSKSGDYFPPIAHRNDDIAKRWFYDIISDENSLFSKHPEDFALYLLADFDPSDGQIDPSEPLHVIDAIAYKKDLK